MALPTMAEELEKFKVSPHYERCKELLSPDFIDKIVDTGSALYASKCVHSGQVLLGPRDPLFRKAIGEIAKTVDKTITKKLLPVRVTDEGLTELETAWWELCGMFKAHLPASVWDKIGEKIEAVFAKVRLIEGFRR